MLTPEIRIVVDEEFLQAQRVFAIAQECFEDSRRSAGFQYEALCLQSGDAGESFGMGPKPIQLSGEVVRV
jgi:hypothetical protein